MDRYGSSLSAAGSRAFIVVWFKPFWGYLKYCVQGGMGGIMRKLDNGKLGLRFFGTPSRAVTLVNPTFFDSGIVDAETWAVLSRVWVGGETINHVDLIAHESGKSYNEALLQYEKTVDSLYPTSLVSEYASSNTSLSPRYVCGTSNTDVYPSSGVHSIFPVVYTGGALSFARLECRATPVQPTSTAVVRTLFLLKAFLIYGLH